MANYFLDTSALAKRYHKENGSEYMDRILEETGSRSLISNLSIVELESVLAIKTRTGEAIPLPSIGVTLARELKPKQYQSAPKTSETESTRQGYPA